MISRFFFVVGLILAFMWFLGVSSNFKSEGYFISDSVSTGGNILFFIAPVLSFFCIARHFKYGVKVLDIFLLVICIVAITYIFI
ncbi:hypothetical protein [Shewanella sp. ECSMB14102]|uniref:hypothetical protein n=1 Tax=Shewanella sp. ECSMB14102 TaxID=1579504 RepID=UPI00057B4AA4|nr:hypothetical protein [Shewanella sp. ECSMB14102]